MKINKVLNDIDLLPEKKAKKLAMELEEEKMNYLNQLAYLYCQLEEVDEIEIEEYDNKKFALELSMMDINKLKKQMKETVLEILDIEEEINNYLEDKIKKEVEEDYSYIEDWEWEAEMHYAGRQDKIIESYEKKREKGKIREEDLGELARLYNEEDMPIFVLNTLLDTLEKGTKNPYILYEAISAMSKLKIPIDAINWKCKPQIKYVTKEYIDEVYSYLKSLSKKEREFGNYISKFIEPKLIEGENEECEYIYYYCSKDELEELLIKDGRFVIEYDEVKLKR